MVKVYTAKPLAIIIIVQEVGGEIGSSSIPSMWPELYRLVPIVQLLNSITQPPLIMQPLPRCTWNSGMVMSTVWTCDCPSDSATLSCKLMLGELRDRHEFELMETPSFHCIDSNWMVRSEVRSERGRGKEGEREGEEKEE